MEYKSKGIQGYTEGQFSSVYNLMRVDFGGIWSAREPKHMADSYRECRACVTPKFGTTNSKLEGKCLSVIGIGFPVTRNFALHINSYWCSLAGNFGAKAAKDLLMEFAYHCYLFHRQLHSCQWKFPLATMLFPSVLICRWYLVFM